MTPNPADDLELFAAVIVLAALIIFLFFGLPALLAVLLAVA